MKINKFQVKALLIACVCHDIDHVGLTNNFLQLIRDDLALLYETSILENHHWQTTHMLLKDYDIFTNFTEQTTKLFYQEIHKAILATDLALYFESRVRLIRLYNSKTFSWVDHSHRDIIKSIMMNTCDLSGQCKPFLAARRITDCLYREFYRQGDMEKELGVCPLSVMDRDKELCIPEDQIRFLNVVVIPCVELLRAMLPNTRELNSGAL
jgi:cAMP and cAMP-inhibited cGMP 3',5'-cyclic phosphodiesterase 10